MKKRIIVDRMRTVLQDCMAQAAPLTPAECAEFIDSPEIPEVHIQAENLIEDDFKAFRDP
jgi:hypothetical protein